MSSNTTNIIVPDGKNKLAHLYEWGGPRGFPQNAKELSKALKEKYPNLRGYGVSQLSGDDQGVKLSREVWTAILSLYQLSEAPPHFWTGAVEDFYWYLRRFDPPVFLYPEKENEPPFTIESLFESRLDRIYTDYRLSAVGYQVVLIPKVILIEDEQFGIVGRFGIRNLSVSLEMLESSSRDLKIFYSENLDRTQQLADRGVVIERWGQAEPTYVVRNADGIDALQGVFPVTATGEPTFNITRRNVNVPCRVVLKVTTMTPFYFGIIIGPLEVMSDDDRARKDLIISSWISTKITINEEKIGDFPTYPTNTGPSVNFNALNRQFRLAKQAYRAKED